MKAAKESDLEKLCGQMAVNVFGVVDAAALEMQKQKQRGEHAVSTPLTYLEEIGNRAITDASGNLRTDPTGTGFDMADLRIFEDVLRRAMFYYVPVTLQYAREFVVCETGMSSSSWIPNTMKSWLHARGVGLLGGFISGSLIYFGLSSGVENISNNVWRVPLTVAIVLMMDLDITGFQVVRKFRKDEKRINADHTQTIETFVGQFVSDVKAYSASRKPAYS